MIYLIGGPPKCGKTTLAKRLSQELSVPWISTDSLQCIVREYIDESSDVDRFPASHQRMKSNDEKYSTYSTEEIISAYRNQAKTLHKGISVFIDSEITDGNNHIIEGYHIEPEIMAQIVSRHPNMIKCVFLFKSNELKFVADIKKSTTPNDWIIARTHQEEIYPKISHMICEYGKIFNLEAKKYGFSCISMDNNFENQIQKAMNLFID